jgi:hypothetical protein
MQSLAVTLTFVGVVFGCDDTTEETRARTESDCKTPKPTCGATPCNSNPGEPWCNGGAWQCEHDDPLLCRGCGGVTATTYACRAWKCPEGTCSDDSCLALCPERTDGGVEASLPDAAKDARDD